MVRLVAALVRNSIVVFEVFTSIFFMKHDIHQEVHDGTARTQSELRQAGP